MSQLEKDVAGREAYERRRTLIEQAQRLSEELVLGQVALDRKSKERREILRLLHSLGMTQRDIAAEVGMTHQRVYQLVHTDANQSAAPIETGEVETLAAHPFAD